MPIVIISADVWQKAADFGLANGVEFSELLDRAIAIGIDLHPDHCCGMTGKEWEKVGKPSPFVKRIPRGDGPAGPNR